MATPNKKRKVVTTAASNQQSTGSAFSALASIRQQSVPSGPVSAAAALRARRVDTASLCEAVSESALQSPVKREETENSVDRRPRRTSKRVSASGPSAGQGTPVRSPNVVETASSSQRTQSLATLPVVSPGWQPGFNVQMSTYIQSLGNWTEKAGYICLSLDTDERFTIVGSYGLRVNHGEVTIAGAVVQPSDIIYWICAPLCHAVPIMRCYSDANLDIFPDPSLELLRTLETLSPLYKDIWPAKSGQTYQILYSTYDVPKRAVLQPLVVPPEWNKKLVDIAASDLTKNPVFFVCGPKGAGKSTFTRILSNKLVSLQLIMFHSATRKTSIRGVNIVDIDPGQAEYTPPGLLSLVNVKQLNVAPPFGHPWPDGGASTELIHSHAFGSLSPGADPDLYLNLALDLCSRAKGAPTIINTPGWIQGTGLDLLMSLISRVHATEVIYMSEGGPAETVESLRSVSKKSFYPLPSQPSETSTRTAAQLRAMQTMSYFHWRPSSVGTLRPMWDPRPLSDQAPLVVSYKGKRRGFIGIISYGVQMPAKLLAETLNGMIVAVVRVQDPRAFREFKKKGVTTTEGDDDMEVGEPGLVDSARAKFDAVEVSKSPEGLPYIANPNNAALDSQYSCTIGLALIRGIDNQKSTLNLLTPIPLETIRSHRRNGQQIVLLYGQFDSPTWAYTESVYSRSLAFDKVVPECKIKGSDEAAGVGENSDEEEEGSVVSAASENEADDAKIPWVHVLHGNSRRPKGSQAWRVRRDLGRGTGGD